MVLKVFFLNDTNNKKKTHFKKTKGNLFFAARKTLKLSLHIKTHFLTLKIIKQVFQIHYFIRESMDVFLIFLKYITK